MNTQAKSKFPVKPVVAALALAFSAVNAYAVPTPVQQPGSGLIRALTNTTFITSNFDGLRRVSLCRAAVSLAPRSMTAMPSSQIILNKAPAPTRAR